MGGRHQVGGGSFALVPREQVRAFSELAHKYDAYVSSGGWIETVLRYGPEAVEKYLKEARESVSTSSRYPRGFSPYPPAACCA